MNHTILIFTCSSGGAHNALAEAVGETLKEDLRAEVEIIDLHNFLNANLQWYYQKGQFAFLNTAPRLTHCVVKAAQNSKLLAALSQKWYPFPASLYQLIEARRPSLVVATHPLGALAFNRVKLSYKTPLILIPVNYEAHRFLLHPSVTKYCVPHQAVKEDLLKFGVPDSQIAVTGMPLTEIFDNPPDKTTARRSLNLPVDAPVVLISQGAMGSGAKTVPLVMHLFKTMPQNTFFVVITGRNRVMFYALKALKLPDRARVVGFVNDFHNYLRAADVLIGKAGGMSSTSAFVAHTPLIIMSPNALEVKSANRFVEAGAALLAHHSINQVAHQVMSVLENSSWRRKLVDNADNFVVHESRHRFSKEARSTLSSKQQ